MANIKSIDLELSSSQYLTIADASQTGLDITGDISIMGWFKFEEFAENNTLVNKEDYGEAEYGYMLRILSGKLNFLYRSGASNTRQRTASNALSTGTWYHIAVTADVSAQTINIYVDGSLISMAAAVGSATSIANNTSAFRIGIDKAGGNQLAFMDGLVDEVTVWNKVLSSTEISDNYNSGDGEELTGSETNLQGYWKFEDDLTDETSNGNDLTNNNSATYSTDVPFTGASGPTYTPKVMMF